MIYKRSSLMQLGLPLLLVLALLSGSFACSGHRPDAPNAINALRVAYEPLPQVYDALLVSKVITAKQYNEIVVPADKILYLGIQGAWIAVDTTGLKNLESYKAKIKEGLDLLDTIRNDKLQAATAVIRVLVEAI